MRGLLTGLALGAAVAVAAPSGAQTLSQFSLNRFEPAPAGDRFFGVPGGNEGSHGSLRLGVVGDYAYRPLVLYAEDGDDRVGSVISDQAFVHLGLGVGLFGRLTLSANAPIAVVTEGDSPSAGGLSISSPSGASFGDVRFGARLRLLGAARGPIQLGIGGYVWVPTGDEEHFTGDGSVRGMPSLIVSGEGDLIAYSVHGGVLLREAKRFSETRLGNEVAFGAALGFLAAKRKLQIGPEIYGTTTLEDGFERDTVNAEALLGIKVRAGVVVLGAAAGPGLTRGLGTPTFRGVLSVAVAPEAEEPKRPDPDRDGDGILDKHDACPDEAGLRSDDPSTHGCPDRDSDGIFDKHDACMDVPGKPHEDPKKNGCPPDRDEDGIIDAQDACPDEPGVQNDDPEKNGCPPDRDGDGIIDAEDACPDIAGIRQDDPAKNGCPGDRDGDGIRDDQDACPDEKGKADPDPSKNGCPTLVRVTKQEIVILQQVQFRTASDAILPASDELLEQVANVLREHPEIKKIEVQGHTDSRGSAAYNKRLSQRRAESVVKWLVKRGGIDPARLDPRGYGMDEPIAENTTEAGRQMNRRVQFKITEIEKAEQKEE